MIYLPHLRHRAALLCHAFARVDSRVGLAKPGSVHHPARDAVSLSSAAIDENLCSFFVQADSFIWGYL